MRPWRARALVVIAAALAALAVWLVTDPLLGVELAAPTRPGSQELQPITPALVAATSLVAALAGWGLLALLERFTARPAPAGRRSRCWSACSPWPGRCPPSPAPPPPTVCRWP
jgi:hypothetical protein